MRAGAASRSNARQSQLRRGPTRTMPQPEGAAQSQATQAARASPQDPPEAGAVHVGGRRPATRPAPNLLLGFGLAALAAGLSAAAPTRHFLWPAGAHEAAAAAPAPAPSDGQRRLMELKLQYETNRAISERAYYGLLLAYSFFVAFGTLSNSLICLTVILRPRILSPRNIFIVNLAGSDLLLCVFTMPFSFMEISMKLWNLGLLKCKLVAGLQATSILVSTISITAIALDRYKVIVYPTQLESKRSLAPKTAALLLAAVWLGALLLSLPLFLVRRIEHRQLSHKYEDIIPSSLNYCVEDWPFEHGRALYSVVLMLCQYVVPITIVSVVYAKISEKLKKRLIRRQRSTQLQCQQKRQLDLIKRTHAMLFSVSLIFGLSWLPLNLLNVISDFSIDFIEDNSQLFRIVFAVCNLIGCSSACTNPILYAYLNDHFRKEFLQVYRNLARRLLALLGPLLCCFRHRKHLAANLERAARAEAPTCALPLADSSAGSGGSRSSSLCSASASSLDGLRAEATCGDAGRAPRWPHPPSVGVPGGAKQPGDGAPHGPRRPEQACEAGRSSAFGRTMRVCLCLSGSSSQAEPLGERTKTDGRPPETVRGHFRPARRPKTAGHSRRASACRCRCHALHAQDGHPASPEPALSKSARARTSSLYVAETSRKPAGCEPSGAFRRRAESASARFLAVAMGPHSAECSAAAANSPGRHVWLRFWRVPSALWARPRTALAHKRACRHCRRARAGVARWRHERAPATGDSCPNNEKSMRLGREEEEEEEEETVHGQRAHETVGVPAALNGSRERQNKQIGSRPADRRQTELRLQAKPGAQSKEPAPEDDPRPAVWLEQSFGAPTEASATEQAGGGRALGAARSLTASLSTTCTCSSVSSSRAGLSNSLLDSRTSSSGASGCSMSAGCRHRQPFGSKLLLLGAQHQSAAVAESHGQSLAALAGSRLCLEPASARAQLTGSSCSSSGASGQSPCQDSLSPRLAESWGSLQLQDSREGPQPAPERSPGAGGGNESPV